MENQSMDAQLAHTEWNRMGLAAMSHIARSIQTIFISPAPKIYNRNHARPRTNRNVFEIKFYFNVVVRR